MAGTVTAMKHAIKRPLILRRETVRCLQTPELRGIHGGFDQTEPCMTRGPLVALASAENNISCVRTCQSL